LDFFRGVLKKIKTDPTPLIKMFYCIFQPH
jgi:hypothetical protein